MPNCNKCQAEMKFIPAGVSKKTGRAYEGFWACPNKCQQDKPRQGPQRVIANNNDITLELMKLAVSLACHSSESATPFIVEEYLNELKRIYNKEIGNAEI